jgi:hypothetical protein
MSEIRITWILRNPAVSLAEMVETAAARTATRVARRHVLAIQDTTTVRGNACGRCVALHPGIAVAAIEGAPLRLIDARFFVRDVDARATQDHHQGLVAADALDRGPVGGRASGAGGVGAAAAGGSAPCPGWTPC